MVIRNVPKGQHTSFVGLMRFKQPGFLRGVSPSVTDGDWFADHWYNNPTELGPTNPNNAKAVYVESVFTPIIFAKLIAKMAHGLAVFRYGVDGFDPFLTDLILGKDFQHPFYFIGTEDNIPPKDPLPWNANIHLLTTTKTISGTILRAGDHLIVVRVRIFADLGAPVYKAIVGKHRVERARLKPYDKC